MDPKKLSEDQVKILARLESAKKELSKKPNVLAVGVGIKEKNKQFTDEISFRVFVKEKKDKAALKDNELIPSEIEAFKTDVLTPYIVTDRPGVCGDERRTLSQHRPLQAGIAISTDSTTYGTLGWFGTLNSDASPILLTNKHVLWDNSFETIIEQINVAQPLSGDVGESIVGIKGISTRTSTCCCCSCGGDDSNAVDCAIARIDPAFSSDIVYSITNDSTTEVLTVSGTAQAVVGETVRKIGARSAFTTGTVVHIGDAAVAADDPAGNTIQVRSGQVLIIPDPSETYQVNDRGTCKFAFSNSGDSGSVILNASDEIVALLYAGDEKTNSVDITFANNIDNVFNALERSGYAITLATSGDRSGSGERTASTERKDVPESASPPNQLEAIRNINGDSLLRQLFNAHFEEILDLVNHCRPVTVAWQRNQGPAFVAAVARSTRVEHYQVPQEIEGISRIKLLKVMKQALQENGNEPLKNTLQTHSDALIAALLDSETVTGFAEKLLDAKFLNRLPAPVPETI